MSRSAPPAVKLCLFGMVVLLALTTVAQAVTIYVDIQLADDCTSGEYSIANRDDSGSDGDAYNTIEEATDFVNAGDTIYVRGGTYVGRVDIDRSGSSGNEWTLANYNSEEVWIDGEYQDGVQEMYCLYIDGASYLKIDGINCKRADRQGIYSLLGSYVDVSNLTVTSCHGHGIGLYGDIASGGSHDWTFTNVKSYNNMSGMHLGTKSVDSAGNITITNSEMTDGCGQGVTARWDASSANFDAQTVPDRNHQTDLWAASDSTIYISGYGGFIMKTVNSGTTWTQETVPTREVCLNGIWGSSTSDIFAVGAHGVIWNYNGTSWSAMDPGTDKHLYAVSGGSSSAVWAVGWDGTILKYNGTSWSPQTSGTTNHLLGVWAADSNTVFAVGEGGTILKTTNGGTDWSSLTSGTGSALYAIEGSSSSVVWAIGKSGTIRKTTNGGTDWSGQTSPYSRFLTSISVQDSSNVWIGGQSSDAQTLISTSNGGSNWSDESGRIVWGTMGWPNNDVCINGIKVHSNDEVTIAAGEYNENADGIAATASHDMVTVTNSKFNRNGDDGLDLYNCEDWLIDNCEVNDNNPSFSAAGDGNGVKQGVQAASDATCQWTVIAGNQRVGYDTPQGTSRLKNVTVYGNNGRGIQGCTEVYNVITWDNGNLDAFLTSGTFSHIIYGTGTITGGTNLITDDPEFVDADEYDFTLGSGSPAIDAGTDLGFSYEGTGPDIGAFEYDGSGNNAPSVSAGSDDECTLPSGVTLDGTVTDDGLPDPPAAFTVAWSKISGTGTVSFGDSTAVDTTATFSVADTYVLRLFADDNDLTNYDDVTIIVNAEPGANTAPSVDAGSDDECTLPSGVTLDGTVTDDGNPDPPGAFTVAWSKTSGSGTVSFGDSSLVDTTAGFSTADTYVLRLTADDSVLSDYDELTVIVNAAPVGSGNFLESGGTVVMEAENFDNNDTRTDPYDQNWSLETTDSGYVGSGYMKAPIDSPLENATWANGCELGYDIDFETAGTYHIWLRRYAIGSGQNSVWVGVDGTQSGSNFDNSNTGLDPTVWTWITTAGCDVYISAGTHTFQIRRRERQYEIDRIILTDDGGYTPSGTGPAESSRDTNTAPTANAGSDQTGITVAAGATLAGTSSDDGLPASPGSITTTWTKVTGPGTVTFGDSAAVDSTVSFTALGTYVLQLEADDGDLTDTDTVQIIVNALLTDNFSDNDITDWSTVAGTGWAAASGQATKLADDSVLAAIEKGGFSVSSGIITVEFDITVSGDWRPGNAGLVDADGDGIYLSTYVGDTYVEIGAKNTDDNAITGTGGTLSDATCDPSTGITIKYEVNLDTGEVKGYVDDNLENTNTLDLSGVGAITDVVLQAQKQWYLDNVVVDISSSPSNSAPSANAGSDDSITLPSVATLDGTVTDDGLPDPPAAVTTTWSKTSGSGTVTFGDSTAVDTTAGFSEADTYVLRLTADDSVLSDYDELTVIVNAAPAGTGPFIESGGTVVMEAENWDTSDQRSENNPWTEETSWTGYVSDGYMKSTGGASKTWATGGELTYDIDFSTAGTYYIWMRRYADSKNENAALVGLDGTQIGGTFDDEEANYDQWYWKEHGTTVYISATQHTFILRKEEKNYGVDRIILTDDGGYTPSGNGPAESSR